MTDPASVENRARIARTTCGWRKPDLDRDDVRRYWRDVHSPAIARRAGVFWYRHSPFDAVRSELFAPLDGVEFDCPLDAQLMWQSDVVYLDDDAVARFMTSPADPGVTATLLQDIELIVDRSTTYRSVGDNLHTYLERTGDSVPMGPTTRPTFSVFFRRRSEQAPFRAALRAISQQWSAHPGVLRLRLNLFDTPDMEAERKAGYPVKTHPEAQQYQAWIDLVLDDEASAKSLFTDLDGVDPTEHLLAAHAYPMPAVYTFVHDGRPTIIGLRGYPAYEALTALHAEHATDTELLTWMYGPVVGAGPAS